MSADLLRQAASLMRERAEAATPGPWFTNCLTPAVEVVSDEDDLIYRRVRDMQAPRDAHHIASWHPAVALAVADWLDGVALFLEAKADEEYFDLDGDPIAPEDTHAIGSALAAARAYLNTP